MGTPNWSSRTIWTGDNLPIMRGMNSESVDLIYLDPPFNSKANYAAPIGSEAAGAEFKDTWTLSDIDEAWLYLLEGKPRQRALWHVIQAAMTSSDKSYLIYMSVRLLEMKRLLKPTGSIYLHCDPTMSHYLKLMMDAVFGRKHFRNEIIWKRTSSHNRARRWGSIHDTILFYSAGPKYTWNRILQPLDQRYVERFYRYMDNRGRFRVGDLTGPGERTGNSGKSWRDVNPTQKGRHWELPPDRALPTWFEYPAGYSKSTVQERLDILNSQGLIYWPKKSSGVPGFKRYLTEKSGSPVQDVILDIEPLAAAAMENVHYPTQKPIALLDRIIKASSDAGDVVFDPFCGCATSLVAADRLDRDWTGIDISSVAVDLVKTRIMNDQGLFQDIKPRTDIPMRTDLGDLPSHNSPKIKDALYGEQGGNCNGCSDFSNQTFLQSL